MPNRPPALAHTTTWSLCGILTISSSASTSYASRIPLGHCAPPRFLRGYRDRPGACDGGGVPPRKMETKAVSFGKGRSGGGSCRGHLRTRRLCTRQEALLGEVNAIGTTYLRADLLPELQREQSKHTLREYLDIRVNAVEDRSIKEGIDRSERLHTKLWSTVLSLSPSDRNSIGVSLYIQSLNQVIDLHEQRVMAGVRLRIPAVVWSTLLLISVLGLGELGYQTALTGSTRTPVSLGLVIAFALLLHLIADLDRPLEGNLRTSHIAIRDLRHKLQPQWP